MKIHSYLLALLCGASALLQGCSSEDMPQVDVPDTQPTAHAKLSLGCVSNGTLTRSDTPFYELGFDNENAIYNAVIIIYDKPLNAADAASGHVKGKIYLTKDQLSDSTASTQTYACKYYTTVSDNGQLIGGTHKIAYEYPVTDDEDVEREVCTALDNMNLADNTTYFAIAIANIGNPDNITTSTTVAELRDMEYGGELYNKKSSSNADLDITTYNHFAMAGVNEVKFTTPSANTVDRLYDLGTLMVQRLAARIDISFGKNNGKGTLVADTSSADYSDVATPTGRGFVFPVYDNQVYINSGDKKTLTRIANAEFELTDINLLNAVTEGMYLFEHTNGTPACLGNENWDSNGVAQNMVNSLSTRTIGTMDLNTGQLYTGYKQNAGTGDYKDYSILGYVGENTFDNVNSGNKFTAIQIVGKTNIESEHFQNSTTDPQIDSDGFHAVTSSFNIRHSLGGDAILKYSVVRNTIYRMFIRFFANGDDLVVRWYYRTGNGSPLDEVPYKDTVIYSYILESDGKTPND